MRDVDERFVDFWRDADDSDPVRVRTEMDELLTTADCSDARALFERASLEDFLGAESAAVPLYEASLAHGLDVDRENRARIQLASSLRNIGRHDDALKILDGFEFSNDYVSARNAFVALTLWDMGDRAGALRGALQAADPALGKYRRAIGAYASELSNDEQP